MDQSLRVSLLEVNLNVSSSIGFRASTSHRSFEEGTAYTGAGPSAGGSLQAIALKWFGDGRRTAFLNILN
jgi:hypothetical protein